VIYTTGAFRRDQWDRSRRPAIPHQLPSIYSLGLYPTSGGLMSYVVVTTEPYRQAATYVDRIFKSGKPAELPVEASARFELVIIRPADDILDPVQQDRAHSFEQRLLIVDIEPPHGKAPLVASRSHDCWRELCRIAIAPMIAKVYSVDKIGANAKKTSVER
jgi:hypothetical protein